MKFYELLKEQRVKAGLSQVELAKKIGYRDAQVISAWERGCNKVPVKKIYTLAHVFKIPLNEMVNMFLEDMRQEILKEKK